MTSFSSSGISGSSNGSLMSSQDPSHHHINTPMRVHFTDGSVGGSSLSHTKPEASKVCLIIFIIECRYVTLKLKKVIDSGTFKNNAKNIYFSQRILILLSKIQEVFRQTVTLTKTQTLGDVKEEANLLRFLKRYAIDLFIRRLTYKPVQINRCIFKPSHSYFSLNRNY